MVAFCQSFIKVMMMMMMMIDFRDRQTDRLTDRPTDRQMVQSRNLYQYPLSLNDIAVS